MCEQFPYQMGRRTALGQTARAAERPLDVAPTPLPWAAGAREGSHPDTKKGGARHTARPPKKLQLLFCAMRRYLAAVQLRRPIGTMTRDRMNRITPKAIIM